MPRRDTRVECDVPQPFSTPRGVRNGRDSGKFNSA
jgi:hypothetical protein